MKENFRVTSVEDGKQYWISRSIAVTLVVIGIGDDKESENVFLVHRRGPGCPDNIGKWSANCGYINWGEKVIDAAVRELYEETGLKVSPANVHFIGYNDPIGDEKENVTLRFKTFISRTILENHLKSGLINTNTEERGGEKGEISEFKLISATHEGIDSLGKNGWAFGHDCLLKQMCGKRN